jgi:hypothetical protein
LQQSSTQLGAGSQEVCPGKSGKGKDGNEEESVPGAGTGVKGMTWDMDDVIEPFGFDEPDAISIQGWPI